MKKILIIVSTIRNRGGTVTGLKNMLSLLPINELYIDVLVMGYTNENNTSPLNCNILPYNLFLVAISSIYKETIGYNKRGYVKLIKILLRIFTHIKLYRSVVNCISKKVAKTLSGYDTIISYEEGMATEFSQYIKCENKIAWVHCNYKEYLKSKNINEEPIYNKFHKIVCVSKFTRNVFTSIYPKLSDRTYYIYNPLNTEYILSASNHIYDDIPNKKDGFINIISIGRLNPVKQFDKIPLIINNILKQNINNFHWYLIGSTCNTSELNLIMRQFKLMGEDCIKHFTFLGEKANPYPYIKNCDILVSTSLSEACPYVVNEAKVLGVPVVSNNYPSIYEFINNDVNGYICTIEDMPNVIAGLANDCDTLLKLKDGVKQTNGHDNNIIINRILDII